MTTNMLFTIMVLGLENIYLYSGTPGSGKSYHRRVVETAQLLIIQNNDIVKVL